MSTRERSAPSDESRDVGSGFQDETSAASATAGGQTLRWWPAAMILLAMAALHFVPNLYEAPPLIMMMIGFFGPSLGGLLILAWWPLASRASRPEKLKGSVVVLIAVALTTMLEHPTMLGFGTMIYAIPTGFAAFGVALVALAGCPGIRLPVALVCAALGFGYWDLLQSKGVTGRFASEFLWRWEPTPEEEYLKSIASQTAKPVDISDEPTETPESVQLAKADWPGFRGVARDGKQPGIALAEDWQASPPKQVWRARIGPGWSSFSVAGNHLYTQEQRGDFEAVVCLDANSGKTLWSRTYRSRVWDPVGGVGPRATPTIDDERLFTLGAQGILMGLNRADGKLLWKRDLLKDSGRKEPPVWGFAASPLVDSGLVIVHAGGAGNKGVLAYDAATGKPRWSVSSGDHGYSSAQLATFGGERGMLMVSNFGLQFLRIEDGDTIWEHEWKVDNYRTLQPLVVGNSVVFATSLGLGTRRLTIDRQGAKWKVTEDWTTREIKPDYNDFVEYQGHIYGFDVDIFVCIDLESGQRTWKGGRYGNGQVLLLPDKGQLLVTAESGELILLRADPKKRVELAKFPALDSKTWNHPVLVGNRLYIRNAEEAACYELPLE